MFAINATLLIQMVHFLVAYLLVRYGIIRPALAIIAQEDALSVSVHETIHVRRLAIEKKQQELDAYWHYCKQRFAQHSPSVMEPIRWFEIKEKEHIKILPGELQEQLNELTTIIVKRLQHVD